MNYRSLSSFEALFAKTINGVRREWLEEMSPQEHVMRPTKFCSEFRTTLTCLYEAADHSHENFLPEPQFILEPFKWMKPRDVKVIITAQDPYPRRADAAGIAFHSLAKSCPLSAKRINQNLIKYGHIPPEYEESSDYRSWLSQGVLMTNVSLTTKEGESGAHGAMWKGVIQCALQLVPKDSVAVLFGENARAIMSTLNSRHKVEHVHPVARNDEFFEKDVFREVNDCLEKMGLQKILWIPGPAQPMSA